MLIKRGGGPANAPAAAPSGLFSDSPLGYTFDDGPERATITTLDPTPVAGLELVYVVLPEFDDTALHIADGFRASAIAVDVLFDDGTRLLDGPALDQYGLPATARESFTAAALAPDQWNLRRIRFDEDPRVAVALELVADPPPAAGAAGALSGWLDGIAIAPPRSLDRGLSPVELVDTRRGTHSSPWMSRGNTAPFVAVPHGAVFGTPMTDLSSPHWNYTWNKHGPSHSPILAALAVSHSASIWMGDWGVVHFMPVASPRAFEHAREHAHPHHYSVDLNDGTRAEVTASAHAVVMRFTFSGADRAVRVGAFGESELRLEDGRLRGWVDGTSAHNHVVPRVFVDVRPDAPIAAFTDGVMHFDPTHTGSVTLVIGTSLIATELAASSATREAADFSTVAAASAARWNESLSKVAVEGASDDQLVTLYSNLYRMFLYPSRLGEVDESGALVHVSAATTQVTHARDHTGLPVVAGDLAANNGFWDTYRTEWPALLLLEPAVGAELLNGFVQHYRDSGWVPRWSAPGPVDAMVGTSFDIVLADAAAKAIPHIALNDGYRAALRDATARPPSEHVGRKGLASYLYRGFTDRTVTEGLSWTLESALNDYGVSVMAGILGHVAEQSYFASRALAHEGLFDSASGFFRGREADGTVGEPFDPEIWGGDYTETNAWGMAFSAPHAGGALATLHGGRQALKQRLDAFFATRETAREAVRGHYPTVIHEMTEARNLRFGMWAPSNQPAHHIPFMYAFAGAASETQAIVRHALARLFTGSEIGQGYPGDEDNGEMSAWWFFAALGLYPLAPGSGDYVVCAPLFARMSVRLGDDAELVVIAHEQSPSNVYVQSLLIDGAPWPSLAVPHSRIAGGAVLEFLLGPTPSEWGTEPDSHTAARLVDVTGRAIATEPALIDDRGEHPISTHRLELQLPDAATPALYTLTVDEPGDYSWRLECSLDGESWTSVDERASESFEWPQQLRPFAIERSSSAQHWRVVADDALPLLQVELLIET